MCPFAGLLRSTVVRHGSRGRCYQTRPLDWHQRACKADLEPVSWVRWSMVEHKLVERRFIRRRQKQVRNKRSSHNNKGSRMLKTRILIALTAMICMVGVTAPSAFGFTTFEHIGGSYPFKAEAKQKGNHKFKAEKTPVECQKSVYTGTLTGPSGQVKVTPKYEECFALLKFVSATVEVSKGCTFNFHINGTVTIEASCVITIKVPTTGCVLTIKGAQGPLKTVLYTNITGPPAGLEVKGTVEEITYEASSAAACETAATKGKNGKYEGTSFIEGGAVK